MHCSIQKYYRVRPNSINFESIQIQIYIFYLYFIIFYYFYFIFIILFYFHYFLFIYSDLFGDIVFQKSNHRKKKLK